MLKVELEFEFKNSSLSNSDEEKLRSPPYSSAVTGGFDSHQCIKITKPSKICKKNSSAVTGYLIVAI
jgi:hypothetical protein